MTRLILIAVLLAATPAMAFDSKKLDQGGSLMLDDMSSLIDQVPRLKQEVGHLLAEKHKKMDEIICTGMRFSSAWKELGGVRVAPYDCDFKGKWLHIDAEVRLIDGKGHELKTVGPATMRNAEEAKQSHPAWKWSDKPPPDWDK
jgi:hypothetical protein